MVDNIAEDYTQTPGMIDAKSRIQSLIDEQREKVGQTLSLTIQQKDELAQRIEKIKDDYQPNYEQFYQLAEEGVDSKPQIPTPLPNAEVDNEMLECSSCMYVVFDPKYCSKCFYPICGPCRAILDKNDEKACMACAEEFEAADEDEEEVQTNRMYLLLSRFKCDATTGAKIAKCK